MTVADFTIEDEGPEAADRSIALLQRRGSPRFLIVNPQLAVTFCSPELVDSPLLDEATRLLDKIFSEERDTGETIFEHLDENVIIRVVPLAGESAGCNAVFLETPTRKFFLESAADKYRLTKREVEVLKLLANGSSTSHVAQTLFISELTVGDHIKNLFRKTNTNRRSELVSRVLSDEGAPQPGSPSEPKFHLNDASILPALAMMVLQTVAGS